MKKILFLFTVVFFVNTCGPHLEDRISEDPSEGTLNDTQTSNTQTSNTQTSNVIAPTNKDTFYAFTNNFQDHQGLGSVSMVLTSVNTGETYIVPPTDYSSIELEYVSIDMKVKGECVTIPAKAFPVLVNVCESHQCNSIRSLYVVLNNPAHYSLNGIGGFLIPQVYPVSPCSKEVIPLINNVKEYKAI